MFDLCFVNACVLKLIIIFSFAEISINVHILNANVQFFMKHERIRLQNGIKQGVWSRKNAIGQFAIENF